MSQPSDVASGGPDRRAAIALDRRRVPRGGRRGSDVEGRHPIVLVADQYEDARSPVARYLDRYRFRVLEAASASEASALAAEHRPHVILSGLNGQSASAFYESLAAPDAPPRIVILLASGIDDPIPALAAAVIAKPFSLRPMLEELRRQLRAAPIGLA